MSRITETIGPYSVIRKIGEGGMGTVYLVHDPSADCKRAVKVLKSVFFKTIHAQRFRREFRILKSLNHPGIVDVKELISSDDLNYFVMEYVAGETLKTVIQRDFKASQSWLRKVITWMTEICNILNYIHGNQIIHRDLKPSNIMILPGKTYPRVKLLDFGLVKWQDPDVDITESSIIMGSMMYMAPEQALSSSVDSRADIYSLGVILYEALTGEPPFKSEFPRALMGMHQLRMPERARKRNPSIPPMLDDLIMSMLAKRPGDRPSSTQIVGQILNQVLEKDLPGAERVLLDRASGLLYEPVWVGHETNLEILKDEWHRALAGRLTVTVIQGEAGIGKSRLVDEMLRDPELVIRVVPRADCVEGDLIFGALQRALRKALDLAYRRRMMFDLITEDEYQALDGIIDLLEEYDSNEKITGIREVAIKILKVFKGLFKTGPIILVLEDFHNSEIGLLLILEQVIQQLSLMHRYENEIQGLYFVFTLREGESTNHNEIKAFFDRIHEHTTVKTVTLERLDPSSVTIMAESILGGDADSKVVQLVTKHSEGVPLFVREIIRDLVEGKAVYNENGIWRLQETTKWRIPRKIQTLFSRRLARFGQLGEKVLNAAAVLGREFQGCIHEAMCKLPEEDYLDIMDDLIRARILEESIGKSDTYRFTHEKIRETILENISKRRLQYWHRRAAETISRIYHDKKDYFAETLAYHFEEAGTYSQAYPLRWISLEKALSKGAQRLAVQQLYRALQILPECRLDNEENLREKKRLYLMIGRLERRLGRFNPAKESLTMALSLGKEDEDEEYIGEVLLHIGALYGTQGDRSKTLAILNQAKDIFTRHNNLPLLADCLTNIGAALSAASNDDESLPYHKDALEIVRKLNDESRLGRCLLNMAYAYLALNKPKKALEFFKESLAVAGKRNDKRLKAFNLIGICTYYVGIELNRETAEKVMMITRRVIKTVQETGDRAMLADCLYKRARAAKFLGLPFEAEIEQSFSIAKDLGIKWLLQSIERWKSNLKGGESDERRHSVLRD